MEKLTNKQVVQSRLPPLDHWMSTSSRHR
jgi:hypothetical protein